MNRRRLPQTLRRPPGLGLFGLLSLSVSVLVSGQGRAGLADRIAHTDPARYRSSSAVHGGAGKVDFFALFNADAIDANLQFLHRGVIEAKQVSRTSVRPVARWS